MNTGICEKNIFENLISLDKPSLIKLLRQIADDILALALKGASPAVNQTVNKVLSIERATHIIQVKEELGLVQIHRVEDAQAQITAVFRQMIDDGEISDANLI